MENGQSVTKGWWLSLPGILTAFAGLVTAVAGLVVALHQAGLVSSQKAKVEVIQDPPLASPPTDINAGVASDNNTSLKLKKPGSIASIVPQHEVKERGVATRAAQLKGEFLKFELRDNEYQLTHRARISPNEKLNCAAYSVGFGKPGRIVCYENNNVVFITNGVDVGYENGMSFNGITINTEWRDSNQDGKLDFCRLTGGGGIPFYVDCLLSPSFTETFRDKYL